MIKKFKNYGNILARWTRTVQVK